MTKGIVKAAVLSAIFIVSVLVFGGMMNHTNEDLTTEMAEATLPVITLYENGTGINELHGYVTEMNAAYMRDTITPIDADRELPISIQTYQMPVDAVSYEIRSLDAKRLIADAEVSSYEDRKGQITAELKIQNLLEAGEEYLLIIKLESGSRTFYYYTRIIEPVAGNVSECVDFVLDFNNRTFNSETSGTLSPYMEKTTGDNTTLHYVTLNSSLKQVSWANFNGERLTVPVPSIKEITDTYQVIVLEYVVATIGDNGESEYYNVEEYYRVRYGSDRMYLLNFERTMNQIFRGENINIVDQNILLGIRSEDVEYKANESGNSVAFVQEGELWSFNAQENTLAKIFSFRGYEGIDQRENYREHDIKIVSIDEAGSVDYIVYGYMNRGIHEGQVGMAVYHYDSITNTNEEEAFIPSDRSYEVMKSELGQLMYVNESGELFLMLDGNIYGIDLGTLSVRELVKGLKDDRFAASESNRFLAWTESGEIVGGSVIHILNLSNGKTTDITEGEGQLLKPLGFMKDDFVYGIASKEDVFYDAAGNTTFPMYEIKIVDLSKDEPSILKTYEKSGYYVSDIIIEDDTMYLNRIQYNGTAYIDAEQEMIFMKREGDNSKVVDIRTISTEQKERQVQIALPNETNDKTPRLLTPKETILEEERNVALKDESTTERYYVYVKGDVVFTSDSVTEAIIQANEKMGVVIGDDLEYVWKRSRKAVRQEFKDITVGTEDASAGTIAQCINAMLEKEGINISVSALIDGGETPKSILNNTMKDARVFDLTGCSVAEILYYVSCGSPVFAMTGGSDAVLVIGYDASTVTIFDPAVGTSHKMTMEDADEQFKNAGNIFFTYLSE